jgi:hypothetical protein
MHAGMAPIDHQVRPLTTFRACFRLSCRKPGDPKGASAWGPDGRDLDLGLVDGEGNDGGHVEDRLVGQATPALYTFDSS